MLLVSDLEFLNVTLHFIKRVWVFFMKVSHYFVPFIFFLKERNVNSGFKLLFFLQVFLQAREFYQLRNQLELLKLLVMSQAFQSFLWK